MFGIEYFYGEPKDVLIMSRSCPSKAITQLSWRPSKVRESDTLEGEPVRQDRTSLAVASEDCSLRIYTLEALLKASSTDAGVC
jgi:hypothetical protein